MRNADLHERKGDWKTACNYWQYTKIFVEDNEIYYIKALLSKFKYS